MTGGFIKKLACFLFGGSRMEQTIIPSFNSTDLQNQALSFANCLSAAYSIPLIECIYYNGSSIDQLQSIRKVFDILISSSLYNDAFQLFFLLYQHTTKKRPVPLYALTLFPILIPFFLFEFLEDFDSLLDEFSFDENE